MFAPFRLSVVTPILQLARRVAAACSLMVLASASSLAELPYELISSYPHQPALFTQGLELYQGKLYESSGLYGYSKIVSRRFPPEPTDSITGTALPPNIFAEGISQYRGKLYMLTWKAERGLIIDPQHFKLLGTFAYQGEGWGLCASVVKGRKDHFVMSNGSNELQWLAADSMKLINTLPVTDNGKAVDQLNELECLDDYVIANRWHTNELLIIDGRTGKVVGKLDLSDLVEAANKTSPLATEAVLNGIAYDASDNSWLVTGKLWPTIFRIRFTLPTLPALAAH
ncbi:glutaminyl-peptide cyclotransferase [Zhongshania sp. BJYM1]|jgi:glutaminyl-peptide cyclotransferase|uniref:glutaminyl-peptide cyclotransferase n=1 Tax=Zhongshania aquatica TaxID=2965069 RepID=UPI0022B47CCC|nr:glutaminyl-peptide cyclotransferase [Marortus sp. BJYM1]